MPTPKKASRRRHMIPDGNVDPPAQHTPQPGTDTQGHEGWPTCVSASRVGRVTFFFPELKLGCGLHVVMETRAEVVMVQQLREAAKTRKPVTISFEVVRMRKRDIDPIMNTSFDSDLDDVVIVPSLSGRITEVSETFGEPRETSKNGRS